MTNGKPLIIYGNGDTATLVYEIAVEAGLEVAAFTSDDGYGQMGNLPARFVGKGDLAEFFPPASFDMAAGFIGKQLQTVREQRCKELLALGYDFPNIVQPGAHVSGELGIGNIIFAGAVVGPRCKVGDFNIIWQNSVLPHDNEVGDFNNLAPNSSFSGYAKAGSHCFVGSGSQINNFVQIGDWALVGAGAYASKDVMPESVLVPQRSAVLEGRKGTDFA